MQLIAIKLKKSSLAGFPTRSKAILTINTVTPNGSKINNPVINAVRTERNITVNACLRIL